LQFRYKHNASAEFTKEERKIKMAINLDALRDRIRRLNGERPRSNVQFWRPEIGVHKTRMLPWKETKNGLPFVEVSFYYVGGTRIVAPFQFGKPDPINDLMKKLWQTKVDDDIAIAKKLRAKPASYVAMILREQEDKGVQIWQFNSFIEGKLNAYFLDEEVGDIFDVETGFDMKVTISKDPNGKMWKGKPTLISDVEASRRPSKLSDDPEQVKAWLDAVPNLFDYFKPQTAEEITEILNNWLDSDDAASAKEEYHKFKESKSREEKKPAEKPAAAAAKPKAEVAVAPPAKVVQPKAVEPAVKTPSLDDAFAELMSDD
jgi:hypothetical protein